LAERHFRTLIFMSAVALGVAAGASNCDAGSFKIIYAFQGGTDGEAPVSRLVNIGGTLYGVTAAGGGSANCTGGCGTVFSLTPDGIETVLYRFQYGSDGSEPIGLVKAGKNILIGASYAAISYGYGNVIFSITTTGSFSVLGTTDTANWSDGDPPFTKINSTWYGVNTGLALQNCSNHACGYVYAVTP